MRAVIFTSAYIVAALLAAAAAAVSIDDIMEVNANGSAVVLFTIARIQLSGAFGSDNEMLRRIAFVQTRDGSHPDTFREGYNGGIWDVNESAFLNTKRIDPVGNISGSRLSSKLAQVEERLGIDWLSVQWSDLRQPLHSAIAARLILYLAPRAIPSTSNIADQARFWVQHYNPVGIEDDYIGAITGLEGSVLESSANEFFLGFSSNHAGAQEIRLYVTTPESTSVNFMVEATGLSFSGVAGRNSSAIVIVPTSLEVDSASDRNKGIHVKAEGDKRINVYGLSYSNRTSDAFLALPCSRLAQDSYEYFAVSASPSPSFQPSVLVVACEDNTEVTIGSSGSVTLNRSQTYLSGSSSDITGTRITSTKPVALFGNHPCAQVPDSADFCDHLTEQIPPTTTWGSSFMAASFLGRSTEDVFRVVASQPSTSFTINCTSSQPVLHSLSNSGSWQEFTIARDSFCSMTATEPVLLMQFALGSSVDKAINGGERGDPLMMMLPPVQQYSNNYVINILTSRFAENYITICVALEDFEPNKIFVDSTNLASSQWNQVCSSSGDCGYITRMMLTTSGDHQIRHEDEDARIGVLVYGQNTANSYGYPAGLKLTPVQLATVSFSSNTYQFVEGIGAANLSVIREGNEENLAVVLVASENSQGTASAGVDYRTIAMVLEFEPGETEIIITVDIINDKRTERNETFQLYLTAGQGVQLTPFSKTEITIEDDDVSISLSPSFGSMLGGTGVLVSGTQLSFKEDDEISCIFDGINVTGVYVNEQNAFCVSPILLKTGRLLFQIEISRGMNKVIGESKFTSLSFEKAFEAYIGNAEMMFSSETSVHVEWSPESMLPMENPNNYEVDISLLELNTRTRIWSNLASLGTGLPNSGSADVRIPNIQPENTLQQSISAVVVQISLSSSSIDPARLTQKGINSDFLKSLSQHTLKTIINGPVRFLNKVESQMIQRMLCSEWSNLQSLAVLEDVLTQLIHCPLTLEVARLPNQGLREDRISSMIPIVGRIRNFTDTLVDDLYQQYFYSGTTECFHQRIAAGSSQQCCYSSDGMLVSGAPGGGRASLVSPNVDIYKHLQEDIFSYLLCCKAGQSSNCAEYYSKRPSDRGIHHGPAPFFKTRDRRSALKSRDTIIGATPPTQATMSPPPQSTGRQGVARPSDPEQPIADFFFGISFKITISIPPFTITFCFGDPHITTHDGFQYTFNGKGEYVLIDMPEDIFTLQGRMFEINNTLGDASLGTVYTALVGRQMFSDTVQFEIVENNTVIVLINGEQINFNKLKEQEFSNVTVSNLGNNSFSASFSVGVYLEVGEANGFFSTLVTSLPQPFRSLDTRGLMGSYNGNASDDLIPRGATEPLPLNSTMEEIHRAFGLSWIVDTPEESLFTYQPGESWATFYDPFYMSSYETVFDDPALETQAKNVCSDDKFCLYDVAATGNIDIGMSTLSTGKEIERTARLSNPEIVICDPACFNGMCIRNDTCQCITGYTGALCNEEAFSECDSNPCQNDGICKRHVLDYVCDCLPRTFGDRCERILSCARDCPNITIDGDFGGADISCSRDCATGTNFVPVVIGAVLGTFAALVLVIALAIIIFCVMKKKNSNGKINLDQTHRENGATEMTAPKTE